MKKLLILLMAFSLFTACNNDKGARNDRDSRTNSRERDDYRSEDDRDKDKTSDRDEDTRDDRNKDRTTDDRDRDEDYNTGGWSSRDVNEFVTSCVNSAVDAGKSRSVATDYCECMQVKLEKKYPNSADAANIDIESPSIKRMMEDCLN